MAAFYFVVAMKNRLRAWLLGDQVQAESPSEPSARVMLRTRGGSANVPEWSKLLQAKPSLALHDWVSALSALGRYEELYAHICAPAGEDRVAEAELRRSLFGRIAMYLDFVTALEDDAGGSSSSQDVARLRAVYLQHSQDVAKQSPRSTRLSRFAVLEDLWKYLQIDPAEKRANYLLFESRSLALRFNMPVSLVAYTAVFGSLVRDFSKKVLMTKSPCELNKEALSLLSETWKDAIDETYEHPRLFFSELAAWKLGLSLRPSRS